MVPLGVFVIRFTRAIVAVFVAALLVSPLGAQAPPTPLALSAQAAVPAQPQLTLAEKELFLQKAKIVRTRSASKGVTNTVRATLTDGVITHDASIQTIDEFMTEFRGNRGTELNFRDSWRYNVAAYRLDQLLDLDMTPPSVERKYNGKPGAFTWWVDDVLMDEEERYKKKHSAPSPGEWNRQMWMVRLFDQLIANVDRNLGNLIIDKSWTIWMIDHSRAFRLFDKIKAPDNLAGCDREVFERLKALDLPSLQAAMKDYLTTSEMKAMLARRTDIVARLEQKGEAAFFNRGAR
jgi:hypothetical protein